VRVVSLVPSVTETLLRWHITPVAVTRFCEQPDLPHVGGTKNPDVAAIVALRPDLVVLCDEENRREDAEALRIAGVAIHVMSVESVDAVAPELRRLAEAVGVDGAIPEPSTRAKRPDPPPRTRAFIPIWRRPWMSMNASTYGSSLLASIGVDNVFGDASDRYPTVTLEDARARAPDVVLAPSEPYAFGERHRAELETVAPVHLVDGQDLFWWGVRTEAARGRLLGRLERSTS
jgi:ABC-type Fe3+-hydroxamate transport system substrate-binding protein